MIQAKQLLDSSSAIRTTGELTAKKKEFQAFVRDRYEQLRHSDMVRRLVAQSFMMHGYVDYHVEDAPPMDIKAGYQQAVLDGVADWLDSLRPNVPEHEILNYCVSLYYERSMVTFASLIIDHFRTPLIVPELWRIIGTSQKTCPWSGSPGEKRGNCRQSGVKRSLLLFLKSALYPL